MDTEKKTKFEEVLSLPEGVRLRTRKFGVNPVTPLSTVPGDGQGGDVGVMRPPLELRWQDAAFGLTVLLCEKSASLRLSADVYCTDPGMLNMAAVSVALVGSEDDEMIRKTIPLDQPDKKTAGCCGSADFGLLGDAIRQLGTELGLVVFMLV